MNVHYTETHAEKSIRIGKRNAYGACDKHKDHFNLGEMVLGLMVALAVSLTVFVVYDINKPHTYTTGEIRCISNTGTSMTETRNLSRGIYLQADDGVTCSVSVY